MNLKNLVIANAAMTMTLKEITDLLNVRHDKAMLKVAEMAKEPEFGWLSKTDIQYSSGKGRIETIETISVVWVTNNLVIVGSCENKNLPLRERPVYAVKDGIPELRQLKQLVQFA